MLELRFVSVHDDGDHVILRAPELDDEEFLLPLTDELRDALAGPVRTTRPEPPADEPLTPREIQSRIRAGEAPEALARAAGVPAAKIERFAGPVLAERTHVADEARAARVGWSGGDGEPGSLDEIVGGRLEAEGVRPDDVEWDSWRRDDGTWIVQVSYLADGARQTAEWTWHPGRRQLRPYGAAARTLSTSGSAAAEAAPEPPAALVGLRMVAPAAAPAATAPLADPGDPVPSLGARAEDDAPATPDEVGATEANEGTDAGAGAAVQTAIDVRELDPREAAAEGGGRRAARQPKEAGRGSGRRAAVPSWDDILFGVKRES
ncbi:MAG: septation protein SepH [Frankiaceae bacterium]